MTDEFQQPIVQQPIVVVVDDDPFEHDLYARAFEDLGGHWRLIGYRNGREASQDFHDWQADGTVLPRVVLQDLYMPPFGGMEMLDFRQQHLESWPVPFIIISTSNALDDIALCRAAGCDDYLVKPRRYRELLDSLRRVVLPLLDEETTAPDDAGA